MSAYRRCPLTGGVRLQEVSVSGGSIVFSYFLQTTRTGNLKFKDNPASICVSHYPVNTAASHPALPAQRGFARRKRTLTAGNDERRLYSPSSFTDTR